MTKDYAVVRAARHAAAHPSDLEDRYLNVRQAADYCGLSERTLYRHMRPDAEHQLPYRKVGRRTLISKRELREWLVRFGVLLVWWA
jgi:excisionase family DNA binding protein